MSLFCQFFRTSLASYFLQSLPVESAAEQRPLRPDAARAANAGTPRQPLRGASQQSAGAPRLSYPSRWLCRRPGRSPILRPRASGNRRCHGPTGLEPYRRGRYARCRTERPACRKRSGKTWYRVAIDTAKSMGKELGADFMLIGSIDTIIDAAGGTNLRFYQVDLELVNLESNEKVWIGQKKIKKLVERSRYKL